MSKNVREPGTTKYASGTTKYASPGGMQNANPQRIHQQDAGYDRCPFSWAGIF